MLNPNQIIVDIHAISVKEGRSNKTGKDYHIEECACMTTTTYTTSEGQVLTETMPGMVILPKHLNGEVRPGKFYATVGLGQFEGKLTLRVVDLTPVVDAHAARSGNAVSAGTAAAKPSDKAAA